MIDACLFLANRCIHSHYNYSPVYTGPQTGSGLESGLRPRNGGGPGDPDCDLDRLRLHGAESGFSSRKVVSCKRGLCDRIREKGRICITQKLKIELAIPHESTVL